MSARPLGRHPQPLADPRGDARPVRDVGAATALAHVVQQQAQVERRRVLDLVEHAAQRPLARARPERPPRRAPRSPAACARPRCSGGRSRAAPGSSRARTRAGSGPGRPSRAWRAGSAPRARASAGCPGRCAPRCGRAVRPRRSGTRGRAPRRAAPPRAARPRPAPPRTPRAAPRRHRSRRCAPRAGRSAPGSGGLRVARAAAAIMLRVGVAPRVTTVRASSAISEARR